MAKEQPKLRKHHWLAAVKVTFTRGNEEEAQTAHTFEHNIAITNDKAFVPANKIGQAQQGVTLELFQQCPDPTLRIINAHVQSISYLGCMTQDEFYTPPPVDETAPAGEPVEAANDPFALKGPTLN